jgi:hypothetical protein
MNSRKWQVGMVALVVLTCGLASFAPFLWRLLKTRETEAAKWLVGIGGLELGWFLLSTVAGGSLTLIGSVAGLLGLLAVTGAIFGSVWLFRPLTKIEQAEGYWY